MIPPETDPRWTSFVSSAAAYQFSCLATRIMCGQVKVIAKRDVGRAVNIAREFFVRNELLAADDLRVVLRGRE